MEKLNVIELAFVESDAGQAVLRDLGIPSESRHLNRLMAYNNELKEAFTIWNQNRKSEAGVPEFLKGLVPAEDMREYAVARKATRRALYSLREERDKLIADHKVSLQALDKRIAAREASFYSDKPAARRVLEALSLTVQDLSIEDQIEYFEFTEKDVSDAAKSSKLRELLRPNYERIFRNERTGED
jgi:hypothetical protein